MENKIATLKYDIIKLEDKLQDNDSFERRDTVILSGEKLPNLNENTSSIVRTQLKDNMNITVHTEDICTAYELGGKSNKKSIIVELCRRDIKNDLVTAYRRSQPDQFFFVNECLTPQRQTIFLRISS